MRSKADTARQPYSPAIRRRRPLPRPRFGLNSSTAFCQATISTSNQTRRFGLMYVDFGSRPFFSYRKSVGRAGEDGVPVARK